MITEERKLLSYLCGNHPFGHYYQIHMAANEYYLRKFWHKTDYGRIDSVDRTLIVRLRDYYNVLDLELHPTNKAYRKFWCNEAETL
jgi:hypothetical protein